MEILKEVSCHFRLNVYWCWKKGRMTMLHLNGSWRGPQRSKLTPRSSSTHQGFVFFHCFFILSVLADAMFAQVKSWRRITKACQFQCLNKIWCILACRGNSFCQVFLGAWHKEEEGFDKFGLWWGVFMKDSHPCWRLLPPAFGRFFLCMLHLYTDDYYHYD